MVKRKATMQSFVKLYIVIIHHQHQEFLMDHVTMVEQEPQVLNDIYN